MEGAISNLLNEGKEFVLNGNYKSAITEFQKAVELLNKTQTEDLNEMQIAEAYFLYGKNLMEKYTYISSEGLEDEQWAKLQVDSMEDGSRSLDKEQEKELEESCKYLNLAKEIYKKKADSSKDAAFKLSEIYLLFMDYEQERNLSNGIININSCINVLKKHLNADCWKMIILQYDLGKMYMDVENWVEAIRVFQKCSKILKRRCKALKNSTRTVNNNKLAKNDIVEINRLLIRMKREIKSAKSLINSNKNEGSEAGASRCRPKIRVGADTK